ncbi:hypothetical protein FRC02_008826 [Tulasnella sp. 418]|nr:hypothetical protein FRC02_008826 [Tulasnella sp. 418]
MSATLARSSLRSLASRRGVQFGQSRLFSASQPKQGMIKDIVNITPVEVYPLLALVGGACTVGVTMGVRSIFTDPTLRVHSNRPLEYEEHPERIMTV